MAGEKSVWDKVDVISKAALPVALALIGFFVSRTLNEIQSRDSDSRLYTQLMTQREDADTGLRRGMFESALKTFLESRPGTPERDLLNLELLAFNFHETLSLKALFTDIQRNIQATRAGDKRDELEGRLQELAIRVSEKQVGVLREAGAVAAVSFNLDEKSWEPINGFVSMESHVAGTDVNAADRRRYSIQLLASDHKLDQVRVNFRSGGRRTPERRRERGGVSQLVFLCGILRFSDDRELPPFARPAMRRTSDGAQRGSRAGVPGVLPGLARQPEGKALLRRSPGRVGPHAAQPARPTVGRGSCREGG